jgi:hypothetical protein
MMIRVQRVDDLSPTERTQLQQNLVWMRAGTPADWQSAYWCVTLENGGMTLAILVESVDESLFDAIDEVIPA